MSWYSRIFYEQESADGSPLVWKSTGYSTLTWTAKVFGCIFAELEWMLPYLGKFWVYFVVPCLDIYRPHDTHMARQRICLYISFVYICICFYAALECIWPYLREIRLDFVYLFIFGLATLNSHRLQRYLVVSSAYNGCVCSISM